MAGTGLTHHGKKKSSTSKQPSTNYKNTKSGSGSGGGGNSTKTYIDGYNKAVKQANARKSDDRPQVEALRKMLGVTSKNKDAKGRGEFQRALKVKLDNISRVLGQQDALLLRGYGKQAAQLGKSRADNRKAMAGSSFANLANRARERGDLLAQATTQGAGESDVLRTGLMALRNWAANQSDVVQSFYDTQRSINNEVTGLNTKAASERNNLYNQANTDKGSAWTNYYNQRTDAWTQLGNIQANPQSNAYLKGSGAFEKAAKSAGNAWKNPGVDKSIRNWEGTAKATEDKVNNMLGAAPVTQTPKRPEGATLRKW